MRKQEERILRAVVGEMSIKVGEKECWEDILRLHYCVRLST
jgi:hypothetical protein